MNRHTNIAVVALFALNSAVFATSALAFQEQNGGAPPSAPAASTPDKAAAPAGNQGNFATPSNDGGEKGGTEISLPGLGKLGVLPKMDFGLELLYGATETEKPVATKPSETDAAAEDDDLRIRGTIKHQF